MVFDHMQLWNNTQACRTTEKRKIARQQSANNRTKKISQTTISCQMLEQEPYQGIMPTSSPIDGTIWST
jgi:hypothetical protein